MRVHYLVYTYLHYAISAVSIPSRLRPFFRPRFVLASFSLASSAIRSLGPAVRNARVGGAAALRVARAGQVGGGRGDRSGECEVGGHSWPPEQDRGRFYAGAHGEPVPLLAGELRGGVSPGWEVGVGEMLVFLGFVCYGGVV